MKTIFGAKTLPELKSLLKAGADLRQREEGGWTLLHDLARKNRPVDMLQFALDRGLKLHARNKHGATILHIAAINGARPEFLQLALQRGAPVNALNKAKNSPLGVAISFGRLGIAQLLVDSGGRLGPGDFPLHDLASGNIVGGEPAARFILER